MPSTTLLIVTFIAFDLVLVWLVMQVVLRLEWNALAERFPARAPKPGAVRRRFQSISIGGANFGLCFEISVDELSLHLNPGYLLRVCGARAISVPWNQVSVGERRRVFGVEHAHVTIGDSTLTGPAWCLKPVRPPARRA